MVPTAWRRPGCHTRAETSLPWARNTFFRIAVSRRPPRWPSPSKPNHNGDSEARPAGRGEWTLETCQGRSADECPGPQPGIGSESRTLDMETGRGWPQGTRRSPHWSLVSSGGQGERQTHGAQSMALVVRPCAVV